MLLKASAVVKVKTEDNEMSMKTSDPSINNSWADCGLGLLTKS